MKYIFTCQENSKKLATYELGLYDESFEFVDWLDGEVGLASTSLDIAALAALIRTKPVIFVRHIFEVQATSEVNEGYTDSIIALCHERLDITEPFSVQTRCAASAAVPVKGIAESIATPLEKDGYTLDVRHPRQVVSVYVAGSTVYFGTDYAENNLSKYKGGMPRFAPTEEFSFISRAEYKLLDIIECMDIDTSAFSTAVDLGAAPGGWTKALVERGLKVTSIDPMKLAPEIFKNKNVRYYCMTAERFIAQSDGTKFDMLVNDMKLDVRKSLDIVADFAPRLNEGAVAVVTFKLPHTFAYKHLLENLHYLRDYELVGARQLFYNRSEITAVYRKK